MDAARDWLRDFEELKSEADENMIITRLGEQCCFLEWAEPLPDAEYYRPAWNPEEMTAYQIYESISEGTPVSPVFETEDDMRDWLRDEWRLSQKAIDYFVKKGYSFSMVVAPGIGISRPGPDTIEAMAKLDSAEQGNE
jgi:hypothetical protein